MTAAVLAPGTGLALVVPAGAVLRVAQTSGRQCVDLIAFALDDPAEHLDQSRTRMIEGSRPTTGARLWSSAREPRVLLEITHDDHGLNDLLFPACTEFEYRAFAQIAGHTNCVDILAEAIRAFGLPAGAVHDPLNLWLEGGVDSHGGLVSRPVTAPAGAAVELTAAVDCLVALSVCGDDVFGSSGFEVSPVAVEVRMPPAAPAREDLPGPLPGHRAAYATGGLEVREVEVALPAEAGPLLDALVAAGGLGDTREEVARAALFTWWQEWSGNPFGDQLAASDSSASSRSSALTTSGRWPNADP